jgi:hypothetical protein
LLIRTVIASLRAHVRYVPGQIGKTLISHRILRPHLSKQRFSTAAKTHFGAKMIVTLPDTQQLNIRLYGFCELHLTRYLKSVLSDRDQFIDIGVNAGYFTLLAPYLVGPMGQVLAAEASENACRELEKSILSNGCVNTRVLRLTPRGHAVVLPILDMIGKENLLRARLIKIDLSHTDVPALRRITALFFASLETQPNGQSEFPQCARIRDKWKSWGCCPLWMTPVTSFIG